MKANNWAEFRIGDFLQRYYDSVAINDFEKYKRITIRTKGQGIDLRDEVVGTEIGTKNQFRVRKNQFLLSKIDAMNGAFGIVPNHCNNGVITGNFWAYDINEQIVLKEYLELLCKKQVFTNFSIEASEGTTNRKYLREEKFLGLTIKLPSIPEQKRLILKLGELISKIDEVENLQEAQERELNNLLFSKYCEIIEHVSWAPMKTVAPIVRRSVTIQEDASYPELGIRCFGKGTFHKPSLTGLEIGTKKIFQIRKGDLLFSNVFAWEGGIAVATDDDDDRYGSHRFISCVVDRNVAITEFLHFHFLTPKGLDDINSCSPGGAGRNKTLGLDKLMKINVPVPALTSQKEFVAIIDKINLIKESHKLNCIEIAEIIPSVLDSAFKGEL